MNATQKKMVIGKAKDESLRRKLNMAVGEAKCSRANRIDSQKNLKRSPTRTEPEKKEAK